MKALITSAACALPFLSAGIASAQTFKYNVGDADHNSVINPGNIGYQSDIAFIDDFALMYSPDSKSLNLSVSYTKNHDTPDGFWFVVSNGPDPKNNANEYAIFYFDATSSSAVVSAYVYDGNNSGDSWKNPGNLLASSLNSDSGITASSSFSGNATKFEFTADVGKINDRSLWPSSYNLDKEWDGARFDEKIGIWFHTFTVDKDPKYNKDGSLKALEFKQSDYFDINHQVAVPEPSGFLMSLIGTSLLVLRRKR